MKKKILLFLLLFLICGCSNEESKSYQTVTENENTKQEEVEKEDKEDDVPEIENPDGFNVSEGKYKWFGRDGANSYITILANNRFEIDTDIDPSSGDFVERYQASGYYKFTKYTDQYPDGTTYESYYMHFIIDGEEAFGYGYVGKTSFTDQWSGYQLIEK